MNMEKRIDGRKFDELREIEAKIGILSACDGSAMFRIGNTIAIAGAFGPRECHPKHLQDPEKAVLKCYYDMMTFSVPERKNPGPGRREMELSYVIKRALSPAIFLEDFPKTSIDVYIQIMQADAGTRCASICAASLALAEAGIPMRSLVSAVGVGKINGEIVLDLTKEEEDTEGAVDMPIAIMSKNKKITLLQMDGKLNRKEMEEAIDLGIKGCLQIYEIQKKILKEKYRVI
jgi:exosome complex component RRP41